jgi:hypothetical protein
VATFHLILPGHQHSTHQQSEMSWLHTAESLRSCNSLSQSKSRNCLKMKHLDPNLTAATNSEHMDSFINVTLLSNSKCSLTSVSPHRTGFDPRRSKWHLWWVPCQLINFYTIFAKKLWLFESSANISSINKAWMLTYLDATPLWQPKMSHNKWLTCSKSEHTHNKATRPCSLSSLVCGMGMTLHLEP